MEINKDNYKDWLIRYFENDLTIGEKKEAEQFIQENEWVSQELDLLKRTRLKPDMQIRFPDKRLLFRTEEPVVELKKPVVVFKLYRYAALAAAAALLAFAVIISIRKPGNRIETAHTNIQNNIIPDVKQPGNPQAQVAPQLNRIIAPNHVQTNTAIQNHTPGKRDFMANGKKPGETEKSQQPVQEKNAPAPVEHAVQNDNYATNKLPVVKQADSQDVKPIKEVTQEPVKKVALVKKPAPSNSGKNSYYGYGEDKSLFQSLLDLAHKVSIKKHVEDQQTYYALSVETPDIKINKTIK